MPTIKVPDRRNSHPYWPDELRAEGYVGALKIYQGAYALVVLNPKAESRQVAKDLRNLAEHFEYRAEAEEKAGQSKEPESPHRSRR